MNINDYSFEEHRYRYAVWTAARAVQRSFATTENISKAIDATELKVFAASDEPVSQQEFDALHKQWCNAIILALPLECSYGRAAKIIAIYLKTAVVLPTSGTGNKSLIIHPPIDRILLQTIASEHEDMKELKNKNWTRFEENDYWELVSLLRSKFKVFNWTLEAYWKPKKEKVLYSS